METITNKITFLKKCFGENYKLSRQGRNIQVRCPVCKHESKLKLSICLETWVCHCWVCNTKGKTPYYIIKNEVSEKLAKDFLNEFNLNKTNETEDTPNETVGFPDWYQFLGSYKNNSKNLDARDCLKYLSSRGLTKKDIWYHKIGFFNSGRLSRRVVFPSFDNNLNLNYFVTRSIDGGGPFKYINCKSDKKKVIFNEYRIDWQKELVLVEGVFDLIKCPINSTCLLGSSISKDSLLFKRIIDNKTDIILSLDSDMQHKSYEIAKLLSEYGISVKILDLDIYHDVGSMTKELVEQKCKEAPNYSREDRLLSIIGTINSGSIF